MVIFQDRRYHPWTSPVRPPVFNITDILWNTPSVLGIGDKWYTGKNRYPQLHIRPWHHMEESDDIREPRFSKCTVPVLFVHHFPFNVAEVYRFAVNNIYFMQKRLKFFDEWVRGLGWRWGLCAGGAGCVGLGEGQRWLGEGPRVVGLGERVMG